MVDLKFKNMTKSIIDLEDRIFEIVPFSPI